MHLGKALVFAAFASCASAEVAAVPTRGDSVVVERPNISRRDADNVIEWLHRKMGGFHEQMKATHEEILNSGMRSCPKYGFSDCFYSIAKALGAHDYPEDNRDPFKDYVMILGHYEVMPTCGPCDTSNMQYCRGVGYEYCFNVSVAMTEAECHEAGVHFGPVCATHVILEDSEDFKICNRGDTPAERPPVTKREIDNRANVVTEQKTVTAPPAGTTTVYVAGSSPPPETDTALSTATLQDGFQGLPHELIMTHASDGTTVVTTALVQTSVVTTVTTGAYGPWTSITTLSREGQTQSGLTTLTDPINPTVTSVVNAASTSCANNTSTDTSSYVNISTFSASGLSIDTSSSTLAFNSTVASLLTSAMGRMSTMVAESGSVGGITTSTRSAMRPLPTPELPASTTVMLGSMAAPSMAAPGMDDSGMKVLATMLGGMGVCFVLALFL